MPPEETCPACGASWHAGLTCEDAFHQMLVWENEDPARGVVHHLAVLGYHLQHPHLYAPDGLEYGLRLLVDFVERGVTPQQARAQSRAAVASDRRQWKIRGKPGMQAAYVHPVHWRMLAGDVVAAGANAYVVSVQRWARSILEDLRSSGNLP